MATRPVQINVVTALDKIGKTNGTALSEAASPSSLSNAESEAWQTERNAIFEYMIAAQMSSYSEKRSDKAKDHVKMLFAETMSDVVPGSSNVITRGGMSLHVEKRKGRDILDSALLMSALAKHGLDLTQCESIIAASTKKSAPATYLKASIVSDTGE